MAMIESVKLRDRALPIQKMITVPIVDESVAPVFRLNWDAAKKLIDFLASKDAEKMLLDLKFSRWSVRSRRGRTATDAARASRRSACCASSARAC